MFQSISEAKVATFKGLVYGRAKPNNLRSTIWFNSVADGTGFSHKVKLYSPMLARMQILKYGSNKNRKKLSHIPELDLTATRLLEPIIHGRGYKARSQTTKGRKKKGTSVNRNEKDDKDDNSVKKLVLEDLDELALKKKKMKLDSAEQYEQ